MNHVMVGAGIPLLVCLAIYAAGKGRASFAWLVGTPVAMLLGALWALVPDIPRMLGMQELYIRMMNDPRMNVFFWHHRLDATETDTPLAIAGCVFLVVMLFWAAWRELRIREGGG
jgi:hypothetical protein